MPSTDDWIMTDEQANSLAPTAIHRRGREIFRSILRLVIVVDAQQTGMQFNLCVRESTVLSPQLKDVINSGLIKLGFIPK